MATVTGRSWHGGELRWNRLAREWTILAPERAARPHDDGACPFCPGPGKDTPPETWRSPANGDWRLRAVPNRFALSDHHEVLIKSPDHHWDPAMATDDEADELFHAWQTHHRALRRNAAQAVVFRNRGHAAGTSLSHPQSQLCGLPVVSAAAVREAEYRREHYARRGSHYTDDLVDAELTHGERVVHLDEHVVVFCPFAPAAGLEIATGVPVVTATPEAAAERLRARLRQSDPLRSLR